MGNQYSSIDRDKEREKEKEKEREKEKEKERESVRSPPRHEKHRSRTIPASPLPPTETKVNAEQTPNNNHPTESKISIELPLKSAQQLGNVGLISAQTSPVKERRTSKTVSKDVVDTVNNLSLKDLPRPTEEEIKKEVTGTEPTPKFETMRVPSQTSLVDEDELREAAKSGMACDMVMTLTPGLAQVPLVLDWNEGGKKVAVAGTFTGWRKRVNLRKTNGGFSAVLQVRPGTHRFHFLVDGEWRISNEFATAVDSEGNLLNYLEATEYSDNEDFEYSRSGSLSCIFVLN
jgi:hypothetical protein